MAECMRLAAAIADGGGVGACTPILHLLHDQLARHRDPDRCCSAWRVTVPLLVAVAYMTYAERKVMAAMQLRRGPNVVGPFGLLQPFADGLKLLMKETIIPSGANRRPVHPRADDHLHAGAGRLGGDPVRRRLGRSPTSMSASSTCSRSPRSASTASSSPAGPRNSKYAVPRRAALGRADGVLRGLDRLRASITVLLCVGSLNLSDIVLAQSRLVLELVLAPAAADVRHLLHLGAGRDQPHAVRPARGRKPSWSPASTSNIRP